MADEYNWDDWDAQASEYVDTYYPNATPVSWYEEPAYEYFAPYSGSQSDPAFVGPTSASGGYDYFAPYSGSEMAAGFVGPTAAASAQPGREELINMILRKQAGLDQPPQKELPAWQQWVKDNQGTLALGLGALGLAEKMGWVGGKKESDAILKDYMNQAAEERKTSQEKAKTTNQAYDYEMYERPARQLTAAQLAGMKRYGRAGSAPIEFFNPSGVLAGAVTGVRDPSVSPTNPLYQPATKKLLAKGGLAQLKDDKHPAAAANMNREAMDGMEKFFNWLLERSRAAQQQRRDEEQGPSIEVEIETEEEPKEEKARGGYLKGGTSGQDDKIPAMLSDGEYVMDADTVAALGDGNNAAGAAKLDKMRQNVRKHKRAAPANKIPPKAKQPEAYLKGKA